MEERLRKFTKLAETKNFTRAANELHTSQPALSVSIAKLEREIGAQLIDRRTLQLTAVGELAYSHIKNIEFQTNNFKTKVQELAGQKPHVRIGIIDSLADTLLVKDGQLAHIERQAQVTLSINNSRHLLTSLEQDQLDIIFVVQPDYSLRKKLTLQKLGSEPLVTVTNSRNQNAVQNFKNGALPDFLAYDKQSHTNQLIQLHFMDRNIKLNTIFNSTSPEIILHMALAGRGSATLPYALIKEYFKKDLLLILGITIERPIVAIWHQDKTLPASVERLLESARLLLQQQSEEVQQLRTKTVL